MNRLQRWSPDNGNAAITRRSSLICVWWWGGLSRKPVSQSPAGAAYLSRSLAGHGRMGRLGRRLDGEPAVGRALLPVVRRPAVGRRTRRRRPRRLLNQPQTGRRSVREPVPRYYRHHHGRLSATATAATTTVVSSRHQRHFQVIAVIPHGAPRTGKPVRTTQVHYIIILLYRAST